MSLIIKIPTWATMARIPAGAPDAGLAALNSALQTTLAVGDFNPVWYDLQDLDLGGGPLTRGSQLEDLAVVTPIENTAFIGIANAQLAVIVGGDIEGMQVFFELDDLDGEVPVSFSNRTYTEPNADPEAKPVEHVHTWATWGSDGKNHAPIQIGEKWYKSNSDVRNLGQPTAAHEWALSGLTTLTVAQYKALLHAPSP